MARHHINAEDDEFKLLLGHDPDPVHQGVPVESENLGYVGDRILGQPGRLRGKQEVAGRLGPAQIAGEHDADDGDDATPAEGVALNDDDRAPEARLGSDGIRQLRPPDLALGDYQSDRLRIGRAALAANSLSLALTAPSI